MHLLPEGEQLCLINRKDADSSDGYVQSERHATVLPLITIVSLNINDHLNDDQMNQSETSCQYIHPPIIALLFKMFNKRRCTHWRLIRQL